MPLMDAIRPGAMITALILAVILAGCTAENDKEFHMNDEKQAADPAIGRAAFANAANIEAPGAEKRPHEVTQHGETRVDAYHWLRDDNWQKVLKDPKVLREDVRQHLEAENAYHEKMMADVSGLRDRLYEEMRGRIKEDDSSVPSPDGPYAYYVRFREGGEYPVFARKPADGGEETVLFDGDAESEGHEFFDVEAVDHSPNHELIAFGVDTVGSEYFSIRVRNIETGEELDETIEDTGGEVVWASDSQSFFYIERDDNQRPKRVKHHVLGTDPDQDRIVYDEPDDGMFVDVGESQSGQFIFISSGDHTTTQTWFLPADEPRAEPKLIAPRREDELYEVDHRGEHFYIHTNADGAVDFKIMRTPVDTPGRENWEEWLPHEPGRYISTFVTYKDYLVRLERRDARPRIVVSTYEGESHAIPVDAEAYSLGLDAGYEFDTSTTRFTYGTPAQPKQTFDYDMVARDRTLRKTREVPSGHDPERYTVERIDAESTDGASVPVTILRLKSTPLDGTAPVLLYGYGSYGAFMPDGFSASDLSLVDRGVIYAVAKVRGGTARGRQWYLDGKLEKKENSFTDFLNSARALIDRSYTSKGRIVLDGRSAGGLLVGATVNLAPELFGGVIGGVPFVDVLNTMSDESLPLTPPEWPEWGNPVESREDYETIKAYSPYDNIRTDVVYPPIMATAGLADYRVTYWEPAKWIAKLRAEAKGGPFLLKTNMEAGHGGAAARFEALREQADLYTFALKVLGRAGAEPVAR